MLVSDLITGAFEDLGVITVNETITTGMQTDGFTWLNPLLDQLSAEGLGVPSQVMQTFPLSAGVVGYTLGPAGTWATAGGLAPLKVTAWRAASSDMLRGGPALRMDEFGLACTQAQKDIIATNVAAIVQGAGSVGKQIIASITALMEALEGGAKSVLALPVPPTTTELIATFTGLLASIPAGQLNAAAFSGIVSDIALTTVAPIPTLLGADTAFPSANVRIWPPPSNAPGSVEVAYTTPLLAFTAVSQAISLPPGGWVQMLRWNLARELWGRYPTASRQKMIWERADATKDILRVQAAMPARASQTQPQPDPQQQGNPQA